MPRQSPPANSEDDASARRNKSEGEITHLLAALRRGDPDAENMLIELVYKELRALARRYMGRNFHAVRLALCTRPADLPDGPLVVVLNHPSWWDPLMGMVLSDLLPDRRHYAPIEAAALAR